MENEQQNTTRKPRATRVGVVNSRSGDKTISVTVDRLTKHPIYGKFIRRHTKLAVDDPKNEAGIGDKVEICPCRRLSKRKSWRLVRVVKKANLVEALSEKGN